MPCIQLSTNQILSSDKQTILKKNFGKAIEIIPGKSEKWLMCKFQSACDMWFQGEQKYVVFLEVSLYGEPEGKDIDQLTKQLTQIISQELDIELENIYVKYSMTPYWGWNGKNLGR